MKNAFVDEANRMAEADPRIVVLCADTDDSLFAKYKDSHPSRYYNTGKAESNTICLAAGLASCGLLPVCYAPASFVTSRAFEQVKLDVCYHNMPVVIVGTDAGLSYASLGATQHSLEDIALMRTLPGMRVLAPADSMELRSCLRAALSENGPTYIRIGKKGEPAVFPERPTFAFGAWKKVRQGSRVTLLATGNILPAVLKAADLLEKTSLCPRVYSCASIKPLDTAALLRYFAQDELVVTIEEHSRTGGLGSAVLEWLADNVGRQHARLLRLGTEDKFLAPYSSQTQAREASNLSPSAIAATICSFMEAHR